MTPLLVLDDRTMESAVLANPSVLNEFPFLKSVKAAVDLVGNCPPCQRGAKGQAAKQAVMNAKSQIASMPPDRKERMRQLLNARRVRVYYNDAGGQRHRADF